MFKKIWIKVKQLFKWLWSELKDWRTFRLFIIVFLIMSIEVWLPYLLGFIIGINTPAGKWLVGIASACWLFWLGPFTPFMPICISITLALKRRIDLCQKKKKH